MLLRFYPKEQNPVNCSYPTLLKAHNTQFCSYFQLLILKKEQKRENCSFPTLKKNKTGRFVLLEQADGETISLEELADPKREGISRRRASRERGAGVRRRQE